MRTATHTATRTATRTATHTATHTAFCNPCSFDSISTSRLLHPTAHCNTHCNARCNTHCKTHCNLLQHTVSCSYWFFLPIARISSSGLLHTATLTVTNTATHYNILQHIARIQTYFVFLLTQPNCCQVRDWVAVTTQCLPGRATRASRRTHQCPNTQQCWPTT